MSKDSNIQWTHHTFNPVRGCTKISPGCANCYAARDALRFPSIRGIWGDAGTRIAAVPDSWKEPVKWNSKAEKAGERQRVFCASLADIFEDWQGDIHHPDKDASMGIRTAYWRGDRIVRFEDALNTGEAPRHATMDDIRAQVFQLIEYTPHLDWQLLTKRPENVMRMVPDHWNERFPENVWMGTTVENQEMAEKRIPELFKIPASVLFLSGEPLLGELKLYNLKHPHSGHRTYDAFTGLDSKGGYSLNGQRTRLRGIDWIICGGESGPNARPMEIAWAESLSKQCEEAGVPFFMKQLGGRTNHHGELADFPFHLRIREFPAGRAVA